MHLLRHTLIAVAVATTSIAAPATLPAQVADDASALSPAGQPEVVPGARVRILLQPERAADAPQELRGVVTEVTEDSISIRPHTYVEPVAVPRGWIARLDVSLGPETAWQAAGRGALTGLLAGAALGTVVGAEIAHITDEPFVRTTLTRAAGYGLTLAVTNAFLQATRAGERWRTVPVRAVAAPDPVGGGFTVGATVRW